MSACNNPTKITRVIRSADRSSGTASSFIVPFQNPREFKRVTLLDVVLPQTIYNITAANNSLDFSDGATLSVTITPGAYSITNLLVQIATQMNVVSTGWAWTYNGNQLTSTVVKTGGSAQLLGVSGTNHVTSILPTLGFTTDQTGALTYTGANVVQLANPLSVYINVAELGGDNCTSGNLFYTFRVPITTTAGGIVEVTPGAYFRQCQLTSASYGRQLSYLSVSLVYASGVAVNLNGSDFEFELEFSN